MKKNKSKLTRAELAKQLARHYRFAEYCHAVRNERKALMLKRHAYFSSLAEDCPTLDIFMKKYDELFNICGVDLSLVEDEETGRRSISAWIQLDYTEYECYYFEESDGKVVVSPTISWQNEVCANEDWNIFEGDSPEEDD